MWGAVIALLAAPAGASDTPPAEGDPAPSSSPAAEVGLDQLLRLPNSFEADVDRRGGATASEWRTRFAGAREEIDQAKRKLTEIEQELGQISGSSAAWQVSAPGSSDPQTSPLSLRLRQEVREQRGAIDDAERRLRALDVEADLAAVPEEWRE
jgi:hypothetical protein